MDKFTTADDRMRLESAQKWFVAHPLKRCTECDGEEFIIEGIAPLQAFNSFQHGDEAFDTLLVRCNACGLIRHFSAKVVLQQKG